MKYSGNTTYEITAGFEKKNSSKMCSIFNLLQRSYEFYGLKRNNTNRIVFDNTTQHLLQENSSYNGVDVINSESLSNASILIVENNFTTEKK